LRLHCLRAFTEQGMIVFASNQGEILGVARLLENDAQQLHLRFAELFAGGHPLRFEQALLDNFGSPSLNGEVGLREGDLLLSRIAVLRDEIAGILGRMMSGTSFVALFGIWIVFSTSAK
jgi:hypothetical protein